MKDEIVVSWRIKDKASPALREAVAKLWDLHFLMHSVTLRTIIHSGAWPPSPTWLNR